MVDKTFINSGEAVQAPQNANQAKIRELIGKMWFGSKYQGIEIRARSFLHLFAESCNADILKTFNDLRDDLAAELKIFVFDAVNLHGPTAASEIRGKIVREIYHIIGVEMPSELGELVCKASRLRGYASVNSASGGFGLQ